MIKWTRNIFYIDLKIQYLFYFNMDKTIVSARIHEYQKPCL